jgi:hypothetical protein
MTWKVASFQFYAVQLQHAAARSKQHMRSTIWDTGVEPGLRAAGCSIPICDLRHRQALFDALLAAEITCRGCCQAAGLALTVLVLCARKITPKLSLGSSLRTHQV